MYNIIHDIINRALYNLITYTIISCH